ncbi:MAG: hypothetical protein SFV54_01130 [Bryobacteraceae bacterium]|nr:hypothetical protein [Bryobacteraceae bacterium]
MMYWLALCLLACTLALEAILWRGGEADGWQQIASAGRNLALRLNAAAVAALAVAASFEHADALRLIVGALVSAGCLVVHFVSGRRPVLGYNVARHDRLAASCTRPQTRAD